MHRYGKQLLRPVIPGRKESSNILRTMPITDDDDPIATSLMLKIGRSAFDGGNRDWLATTYAVSLDDVDRSWLQCRDWLSEHFAKIEERDYTLLDEDALRERLEASLRLLIDWHAHALQSELVHELTPDPDANTSESDNSSVEPAPTPTEPF